MQTPFIQNQETASFKLLNKIISHSQQSRTILLIGKSGWGKVATSLDITQKILECCPLESSDFFYFRNDKFSLKTIFFLRNFRDNSFSWTWLKLLQRRLSLSLTINESLSTTLSSVRDELSDYISRKKFPDNENFIKKLITIAEALDKKSGIPIDIMREAILFHSTYSHKGRVSIIADFDKAEKVTQNAALKLFEEPLNNHWIILTAENEKNILPTILSRTLKIKFKQPLPSDFYFLNEKNKTLTSARDIMADKINNLSAIGAELIALFFKKCLPNIEYSIELLKFCEELGTKNQADLFLNELIKCFGDAVLLRQKLIRDDKNIAIKYGEYYEFSSQFRKATTAELEEIVSEIEYTQKQIKRSVIKAEYVLPALFLKIGRLIRKIHVVALA